MPKLKCHPHEEMKRFIQFYQKQVYPEIEQGNLNQETRREINSYWNRLASEKRLFESLANPHAYARYATALINLGSSSENGISQSLADRHLNEIEIILKQDIFFETDEKVMEVKSE